MANLSQGTLLLLDRLYNLKGEDNTIISDIKSSIEAIELEIKSNGQKQEDCLRERDSKESYLLEFRNQAEVFTSSFEVFNDDTFAALGAIGVDARLGTLVDEVREKAQPHIEKIEKEIDEVQRTIDGCIAKNEELIKNLSALKESKAKSEKDRNDLRGLLEQSLSDQEEEREALSTRYIKDILGRFGVFSEEEVRTLSKLIIFPDEGLKEYDEGYEERLQQLAAEPSEEVTAEAPVAEAPAAEEPVDEDDKKSTSDIYDDDTPAVDTVTGVVVEEPATEEPVEEVVEETSTEDIPEEPKREDIKSFLEGLGMDMKKFAQYNDLANLESLMLVLANTDRKLIEENYEILKSLNAEEAAYKFSFQQTYLADTRLNSKVALLSSKGISEKAIAKELNSANSFFKLDYETIVERIDALEQINEELSDSNLGLLMSNVVNYVKNLEILQENDYVLDDKEKKTNESCLTVSPFVRDDIEILKNYLIDLTRKNGKYALNIFWKDPQTLVREVDDLIESNLENIIATNPETLGFNIGRLISRVRYCEANGQPITDTTGQFAYASYILDERAFVKEFGAGIDLPAIPDRREINAQLPEMIGNQDFVQILVNSLDEYYNSTTNYRDVELSLESNSIFERLMSIFEEKFQAKVIGKYTYQIGDIYISKNKLERNLKAILDGMEKAHVPVEGNENEIVLTTMLYNTIQDPEAISKVVQECLGFNQESTVGGKSL